MYEQVTGVRMNVCEPFGRKRLLNALLLLLLLLLLLQGVLPFAVVGSTEEVKIGNKMVKARQYPWGVVQGECPPPVAGGDEAYGHQQGGSCQLLASRRLVSG